VTEITVMIATFNRAPELRRCVDALARQTASPESLEVVVVDDSSATGTTGCSPVIPRFSMVCAGLSG
jgi:glycosyltransferase involved in cell wall biosynthesis